MILYTPGGKEKTKYGKRQKDNEKTKTVCSVSLARVSQGLGSDGRGRRRAGTTFQHLLQAQKSQPKK